VVAATDIPFAARIDAKNLKLVEWPVASVPAGALKDLGRAEGRIAQHGFLANEPITEERIREHLGGSTLSAMIKPGMRAISVRVDDVAGVAGFILPGNRVDILGSLADKGSYTVLSGVNVLAIDQEASPDRNQPALVRSLTLEVSPHQAERLDQASHHGPLRFTLRNPADQQPALQPLPVPAPPRLPPAVTLPRVPVPRAPPPQPSVTIIEWTGKGKPAIDRCNQWPCMAGQKRSDVRAAREGSAPESRSDEDVSVQGSQLE
jgi:pilus assembly protein CpaB